MMTKEQIVEKVQRLQQIVNGILRTLQPSDFPNDPINWMDLRCVSACYTIDQGDRGAWEVMIEEAAPEGCAHFSTTISKKIPEEFHPCRG